MAPIKTTAHLLGILNYQNNILDAVLPFFLPNQYGAYRMYLNGDFILRLGEVGKDKNSHRTEKCT